MPAPAIAAQTAAKATKTTMPIVTSLYLQFNLQLRSGELSLFREAVLKCIAGSEVREIFSNETKDKDGKQKKPDTLPPGAVPRAQWLCRYLVHASGSAAGGKICAAVRQELSLAV